MKRWLIIGLLILVFYVLSLLNKNRLKSRFPFLKRLDYTLTIGAWVMLGVYMAAFVYWLITEIF
jgi:hypothetical protein